MVKNSLKAIAARITAKTFLRRIYGFFKINLGPKYPLMITDLKIY